MIVNVSIPGGRVALGSGNTVCNYVPLKDYFATAEKALSCAG